VTETFGKTKDRKPNMSMRHSRKIKEQKGKSYSRLNLALVTRKASISNTTQIDK